MSTKSKPDLVPCTRCHQTGEISMAETPGVSYDFGSGRQRQAALLSKVSQKCPDCRGFGWKVVSAKSLDPQELPSLSGKPNTFGK